MLRVSFFLCLSAIALSSCGLRPALKQDDPSSTPVSYIKDVTLSVIGIEGQLNHVFYQELYKHLRLFKEKLLTPLHIKITLSHALYDVSYGRDATALRSQNVLYAFYEISQKGRRLKKGTVDAVSSYNLDSNDAFTTLTSRLGSDDAVIRALAAEVAREVLMAPNMPSNMDVRKKS